MGLWISGIYSGQWFLYHFAFCMVAPAFQRCPTEMIQATLVSYWRPQKRPNQLFDSKILFQPVSGKFYLVWSILAGSGHCLDSRFFLDPLILPVTSSILLQLSKKQKREVQTVNKQDQWSDVFQGKRTWQNLHIFYIDLEILGKFLEFSIPIRAIT